MKRLNSCLAMLVFLWASPAFALFQNGGFETGDFSGWSFDYGIRPYGDTQTINWGQGNNGLSTVMDNSATMPGQTQDVNPYNGNYMARINDIFGNYHATKIWQQDTITQADIDNGAKLYVNWGAALIEPVNSHPTGAQPYFGISVWAAGVLQTTFQADALDHDATWTNAGYQDGTLWYKADQWSYDLSAFNAGDTVKVEMFVADCGWGGHGGYAFLDGIGTVQPPPPSNVPVPGALVLGGIGTALVGSIRRRRALA